VVLISVSHPGSAMGGWEPTILCFRTPFLLQLTKQNLKASNEIKIKSGNGSSEKLLTIGSNFKENKQHICIFLVENKGAPKSE